LIGGIAGDIMDSLFENLSVEDKSFTIVMKSAGSRMKRFAVADAIVREETTRPPSLTTVEGILMQGMGPDSRSGLSRRIAFPAIALETDRQCGLEQLAYCLVL
jgi:hypothetical protein